MLSQHDKCMRCGDGNGLPVLGRSGAYCRTAANAQEQIETAIIEDMASRQQDPACIQRAPRRNQS
jgi:hypothetical protein